MWNDFSMQGGMALLKAGVGYLAAAKEAKEQKAWQAYKNAMVRISDAQNQNTITTNKNIARERSAEESFAIERSAFTTKAAATVAAASMGVEGNSVDSVIFDIERNAAYKQQERIDDLNMEMASMDNQRRQSAMQATMSLDRSPIPGPNLGAIGLNLATDVGKLWQQQKLLANPSV